MIFPTSVFEAVHKIIVHRVLDQETVLRQMQVLPGVAEFTAHRAVHGLIHITLGEQQEGGALPPSSRDSFFHGLGTLGHELFCPPGS